MARVNHLRIENRIMVCREYAELWQAYFEMFGADLENRQITEQMERDFDNIMGILALNHYKFSELCGEFLKDAPEVMKIMAQTPSLQVVKDTPEATLSKLQIGWHTLFIDMNKALGRMIAKLSTKELEAMQAAEAQSQGGVPA
ncbi:hypothetical protein BH09SUM1_BH09SUM1_25010 [soil metagenome]